MTTQICTSCFGALLFQTAGTPVQLEPKERWPMLGHKCHCYQILFNEICPVSSEWNQSRPVWSFFWMKSDQTSMVFVQTCLCARFLGITWCTVMVGGHFKWQVTPSCVFARQMKSLREESFRGESDEVGTMQPVLFHSEGNHYEAKVMRLVKCLCCFTHTVK